MQHTINKEAFLLFVSGPEVVLADAATLVESHGGFCAAFTKDYPQSPKPMSIFEFLMHLRFMTRFAKIWGLLEDLIASWTLKQRWRCVWKGRVSQGPNMLKRVHPQKMVLALAIKGGRQCDWEQEQFSPGGVLHKRFPDTPLMIFKDLDDLMKALGSQTSNTDLNQNKKGAQLMKLVI